MGIPNGWAVLGDWLNKRNVGSFFEGWGACSQVPPKKHQDLICRRCHFSDMEGGPCYVLTEQYSQVWVALNLFQWLDTEQVYLFSSSFCPWPPSLLNTWCDWMTFPTFLPIFLESPSPVGTGGGCPRSHDLTWKYSRQLSANILTYDATHFGRSFIWHRRTLACGIP